jgi:hypothetical protein
MYGRYLDLHEFFHEYVNMTAKHRQEGKILADANGATTPAEATAQPSLDYITYVQQFTHFHRVSRSVKFQKAYSSYIERLLRYLMSFHERTQPLKPVAKLLENVEDRFEEQWAAGQILGWEDRAEGALPEDADLVIDVDAFDSPGELLELGAICASMSALQNGHAKCRRARYPCRIVLKYKFETLLYHCVPKGSELPHLPLLSHKYVTSVLVRREFAAVFDLNPCPADLM